MISKPGALVTQTAEVDGKRPLELSAGKKTQNITDRVLELINTLEVESKIDTPESSKSMF